MCCGEECSRIGRARVSISHRFIHHPVSKNNGVKARFKLRQSYGRVRVRARVSVLVDMYVPYIFYATV